MTDTQEPTTSQMIVALLGTPFMDAFDPSFQTLDLRGCDELTEEYQKLVRRINGFSGVSESATLELARHLSYAAGCIFDAGVHNGMGLSTQYLAMTADGKKLSDYDALEDYFSKDEEAVMITSLPELDLGPAEPVITEIAYEEAWSNGHGGPLFQQPRPLSSYNDD